MGNSEALDRVMQDLSELTQTIKAGGLIDIDKIAARVVEIQRQNNVVRRGEPEPDEEFVGAAEFRAVDPVIRSGKFTGCRRSDVAFTASLLRRAHALLPSADVKLPSDELQKALTSTGSGTGDELVPTGMAAQLWQDFFTASNVVAQFGRVAMPTDPWDAPLNLGDVTWYKGSQNTATTASDPSTAKTTFTTTEQVAEVDWSYHLDEDSVVAVLPGLRDRLGISGGEQMDNFMLNADATNAASGNINSDDADPADTKWYLSDGQDGIRHVYLADATGMCVNAGGDALTDADITSALALMGKYAVNPSRLVLFCDVATYVKGLMSLDGVLTADKYGTNAVLLQGELAKYRGIPIIPSASMPKTEDDGKCSATPANNTLGQIAIAHRSMWQVGFRRELMMEVDRDIQKRQFILVVSFRIAVAAHTARASITHTSGIRNILVS